MRPVLDLPKDYAGNATTDVCTELPPKELLGARVGAVAGKLRDATLLDSDRGPAGEGPGAGRVLSRRRQKMLLATRTGAQALLPTTRRSRE